ncbi:DEAD/DEAH box helicase [Solitalea koreensis]|uniref:Superfamily II DNA or RNA helicase, SNF2 family n=1 Tax=Solitalea koreensis TaxID=543615 RepID=A0A521CF21_9SPHI|nr:DEAD/DEAH box helicase [Solitalea koreensis]SMO58036.1 Superfamily II DNA or RNA helicase, SNF2 family [Solitalea koreensis]
MSVSTKLPFKLIYALDVHPQFGHLLKPFVVQCNEDGNLGFAFKSVTTGNMNDFEINMDDLDRELIGLSELMDPQAVYKKFSDKSTRNIQQFIDKYYVKGKLDKALDPIRTFVRQHTDKLRKRFLELAKSKHVCEFSKEGPPMWKQLNYATAQAELGYFFSRNAEGLCYQVQVFFNQQPVSVTNNGSSLFCLEPVILIAGEMIYSFDENSDGKKLQPFLTRDVIIIPKEREADYFEKFIKPMVAANEVHAAGFDIISETSMPSAVLHIAEEKPSTQQNIFDTARASVTEGLMVFELKFLYGRFTFRSGLGGNTVKLITENDHYTFYKVSRNEIIESDINSWFTSSGLALAGHKIAWPRKKAFDWLSRNYAALKANGVIVKQPEGTSDEAKHYFIGEAKIDLQVSENRDWFDVKAVVRFGEFEIPFISIYQKIKQGKHELVLPNGETAIIPDTWFEHYSGLLNFVQEQEGDVLLLKKHHLALAQELQKNKLLKLNISEKLEQLRNIDQLKEYDLPAGFIGELRPYQKAGYNWMRFLNEFDLGGCLADDMGLGKTVQTLALLQWQKEYMPGHKSLLVLPKSLIYNWHLEARRFAPELKIVVHAGSDRAKTNRHFSKADIVITSYPVLRQDLDLFRSFYFNYIVLDEAQAIKNPSSTIAQSVMELQGKHRLILTGTPVENSTMDLWSQMNFINQGLLGTQTWFKKEYTQAIEKNADENRAIRLHAMVKPFVLRRLKSQVAADLPEKTINIHYCAMSSDQEEIYERMKAQCRRLILEELEEGKSKFQLLEGLMRLRQIANHPQLADKKYDGLSGKLDEVKDMLQTVTDEKNKVLVFSQFVNHLQLVRTFLEEQCISYCYLDGSTENRQEQVDRFQNDETVKVFLISLKAGGTGLNLTRAGYVFLLDPWWNPAAEAQAIDRAHRIGQKNTVMVYKFITKDTVEEKILALQDSKTRLAQSLITAEEGFVKSLSKEDIESLLS